MTLFVLSASAQIPRGFEGCDNKDFTLTERDTIVSGVADVMNKSISGNVKVYCQFVILGADLTAELLAKPYVVQRERIYASDIPDSELMCTFPGSSILAACHLTHLPEIFPNVEAYAINGKNVSKEKFYAQDDQNILFVQYSNGILNSYSRL